MSGPGTHLRDARLHKALAHAPDSEELPAPRTRQYIKIIANNSIRTWEKDKSSQPTSWWQLLWQRSGRARNPWNAAFATVLVGGIITLIWQGQEVPDAARDERTDARPMPEAARPAPAVSPPGPTAMPAPSPAPSPATTPATTPVHKEVPLASAPERGPKSAPQPAVNPAAIGAPKPPLSPAAEPELAQTPQPRLPAQRRDETLTAAPASHASPLPAPASALEKRESPPEGALSADKSLRDAPPAQPMARAQGGAVAPPLIASPAPAPAPAATPDPPPAPAPAASRAPAPAAMSVDGAGPSGSVAERNARNGSNNRNRAAPSPPAPLQIGEWVAADVLYQGRTTRLAKNAAQNLVNRALGLLAAAAAAGKTPETAADSAVANPGGAGAVPTLRLQLVGSASAVAAASPVAQIELRGSVLRLQRTGQADVLTVLTPEAVAGLLAEAARAVPP